MTNDTKVPRRLVTVNAHDLQVNPVAQREFRPGWAGAILADWDIAKFQEPHVNKRADGSLYIMEGQHGTHAYREKYGVEGEPLSIRVWLYDGLTEQEEADLFLALNNKKPVTLMDRYQVAVIAQRNEEVEIDRIVKRHGCRISNDSSNANVISAVGAVQGIYRQHGGRILSDTIATVQAGLGEHSYDRPNLMGISMVLARYGVEPAAMVRALLGVRGGTKGLLQSANRIREATGCTRNDSFAAAMVEAYNRAHRGRGRLANWFASDEAAAA